MNKEQNLVLLLMMFTTLGLLGPEDMTKSISMFRRKIRKKLNGYRKVNMDEYYQAVKRASQIWNETLDELKDEKLKITVHDITLAIHTIISDQELTKKFYTEKQLDKLLNAMKTNSGIDDNTYAETERNTNRIVDIFLDKLDIKRDTSLKTRLHILKENLILEGKYNG